MKEKSILKKQVFITAMGIIVLLLIAVFCYKSVEKAIIENEQESLRGLAKVNAQSLKTSLQAKSNLVYAVLSGDMENTDAIEMALIKTKEKGKYIPMEEKESLEPWEKKQCESAGMNPGEVVTGPVRITEKGYYGLYLTKAVSIAGSIAGYVQIELNLDEIYAQEQALSSLQLDNDGYCIVKNSDNITVMPGDYDEENISFTHPVGNGCAVVWGYQADAGTPDKARKLVAYETITFGDEKLSLYIIEDYDKVTQPIEQVAFYFFLFAAVLFIWAIWLTHKISDQSKKEVLLRKELQHEKTLNETLKKQEGLMQKYNHSKTMEVLSGSIAHEFNNLMTPIVLYAELLEDNEAIYREMPEEIRELKSAAVRCEELAKQLLSYSRQGKAEKVFTDYDASYAVRESVNMVKKLLPDQVRIKENICKTSYFIHGQVGALNQIILNLATNAVHAMKNGGILNIQFGLSTDDSRYVRLIIEDTGTGIPEEIQQYVFQPFFSTKPAGEGTGIGLTVVKRLTEEHGGQIRVHTVTGKGTRFVLDFPRSTSENVDEL